MTSAVARLRYPGRKGVVVRFTPEMLGAEFIAAYPWTREHGWAARN